MATVKKVRRKKLNIKGLIFLLLCLYMIVMFFYTIFTMPIKNIYIKNTTLLKDNEIIEVAGIKNYPAILKLNVSKLEKKIKKLELVNDVSIKKTLMGKLIIDIDEAIPLFYNRNTDKVVLNNKLEVHNNKKYLGIPTLINYVPKDMFNSFIGAFENVDSDVLKMINEIEYDPDISSDVIIDNERFLLRMNDNNLVYVNIINMKKLNDYKSIFAAIGDAKGTILLDSYSTDNGVVGLFTPFLENGGNENGND